jgi:hypothetical protein
MVPLMIANGIVRETLLLPALGRTMADVASAGLGIAIILAVTRPFLRRATDRSTAALVRISAIWLALTVSFEFLFGHYVDGQSWADLADNYALWRGHLWPVVLASVVAAPFLWGRTGGSEAPRAVS